MNIKAVVFDAYGTLYDIQSVAAVTEETFPGYGEIITQVWRIKQLEYSWLRTLMLRYKDFSEITRDSLHYATKSFGLSFRSEDAMQRLLDQYQHLDLYPDVIPSLEAMKDKKLAILSNGSPEMLNALVRNTGLEPLLDAVISVDAKRVFKPSPEAYALIEETLGVPPHEVLFVSANAWDVSGAKSFGLNVAMIERAMPKAFGGFKDGMMRPVFMYEVLRNRWDDLGVWRDYLIPTLSDLPALVSAQG